MINDTPSSRVAVCVLVACLNLITPIAIVFSATSGVRFVFDLSIMSDMGWLRNLRWFALLESIFFLVYLYRRHTMVKNDVLPPAPSAQQRVALWKDAMATIDAQGKKELEALMRGWFVRASTRPTGFIGVVRHHLEAFGLLYGGSDPDLIEMSEIKRGNVEEWLAATFFFVPIGTLLADPLSHHALLSLVFALESRRIKRFQTGYNPSIRPIRPALDPIPIAHRPLLFYFSVAVFTTLIDYVLWLIGFKSFEPTESRRLGYQYHPGLRQPGAGLLCFLLCRFLPARPKQTGTPIILLHGLGGYAPLIHFITTLLFLDRPVFIVDQPHVSFKLAFGIRSTAPPSMKDMVSSVHSMLAVHGFHPKEKTPAALIIAHSLGSALAAALTAGSPHSDAFQTVLIDPVSIRLYDAHLARAFAACRPRSDLSYLLRYFTTEMGVATYVARHFNAFDGGLLLHSGESSERNRTKVILARNDCLLPVNAIQRDCELTGVECEILENTDHGGFLTSLPVFLQVLRAVRKVSDAMTLEGAPQPVSMAAVEDVVKDMAEDTSAIVLVNPPAMGRITSRITHGSSPMACRPSLTQTNVPPCGISSGRAGRGRSRTMCGAPMMPCKSLRVAWGGVVPMEKTESLTRMVAVN